MSTKRYARIEDGVVASIEVLPSDLDIASVFSPALTFVEAVDPDVREGWAWDGEAFAAPPGPSLEDVKAAALAALADRRWRVETGGITVGGLTIPTDDKTQTRVTAAYVQASQDESFTIPNWKVAPGVFVTLDNGTIIAIGDAIVAHVQACFDNESTLAAAIEAAEDEAAVAAVDIETGWPE